MKKMILLLSMAISFFACEKYDEYEVNTVGYTTVYFPNQELKRSAISGEGMEIKIGAYLGGVRTNDEDRTVDFTIDETLLGSNYTLLPADYYQLSNSGSMTIPKGEFLGMIDVKFDSLKFANDSLIKDFNYAIPLRITSSTTDSILAGKDFAIFPIKMMNTFEGRFYQVGQVKKFYTIKPVLDDAYVIGDTLNYPNSPIRNLMTVDMNSVEVDAVASYTGGNFKMLLTVNADNSVVISSPSEAAIEVQPMGASSWDPVKRTFTLGYQFTYQDRLYKVEEKLIFQHRDRDGIKEWRWDGFPGN